MIQPNELRIGNFVKGGHNTFKVVADTLTNIERANGTSLEINPIPLTEEWLLRFGFELIDGEFWCKNVWENTNLIWADDGSISIEQKEHSQVDNVATSPRDVKILYVHQLQNLYFALTGQELTINQSQTSQ